jgi:hypothetical protein
MGVRFNLVVFHTTDRSIYLEYGQRDVMQVRDAMLAQGAPQFVHADALFSHVRFNGLSIVNQKARLALDHPPKPATGAGEPSHT